MMKRAVLAVLLAACTPKPADVRLTEDWPAHASTDYDMVTFNWTRTAVMRGQYQEVLDLAATFKSPEWRAAHAARDADHRGLTGEERDKRLAQAQAEMAGPYEVELMVTTWDRRENDLDRGKKSVWHVVLVDEAGREIEPLEIVKDKRPTFTVRSEFPALGDFAQPYIARFPRTPPILGPSVHSIRLRVSGERGGVEVAWNAPGA
ncbi:MAG: hypothetical protein JO257_31665 [Deltaproteobacteria bacterium]|nr:hypothetical protein [Deltaproteobacteria bacterium]